MTEIGRTLGGRYRLVELLGQGGMATIYRARDAQLERDVAVKLLRPEFGQDPDFLARFRDEARSAASLNHPNIVSVFDFGEGDDGPYIVMELIDGQDLGAIIRENGALPPGTDESAIDRGIDSRFRNFVQIFARYQNGPADECWKALAPDFGSTWWFFYIFGRTAAGPPPQARVDESRRTASPQ